MTPERWGQLEELYQAARALPPSERTALLARADPELRATVASLLAQEEDGAFLDRPAWEGRESLLNHDGPLPAETPVSVGEQIGPIGLNTKLPSAFSSSRNSTTPLANDSRTSGGPS